MRELSRRRKEFLSKMLDLWVTDRLISSEDSLKIKERYGLSQDSVLGWDKVVRLFTLAGALLVGAGVLLFIASNWENLPKFSKLVLIFSGLLGLYGGGYFLKFVKKNYPRLGEALIFCGALFFGAAIWLIAQMYHIESEYHLGMLIWGLGVLAMAWVTESVWMVFVSSLLLGFWNYWRCEDGQGPNFYYLAVQAMLTWSAYRFSSSWTLLSVLAGFLVWLGIGPLNFYHSSGIEAFVFYGFSGVILMILAQVHQRFKAKKAFYSLYRILGVSLLALLAYLYTFSFFYDGNEKTNSWALTIILIFLFSVQGGLWLLSLNKKQFWETLFSALALFFLFLLIWDSPAWMVLIFSNIFLLGISLGSMAFGYLHQEKLLVNLGFLFFVIHFFTRYLDWAWNYLPRALFFVSAGLVLLAGGTLLERKRRKILSRMREARDES